MWIINILFGGLVGFVLVITMLLFYREKKESPWIWGFGITILINLLLWVQVIDMHDELIPIFIIFSFFGRWIIISLFLQLSPKNDSMFVWSFLISYIIAAALATCVFMFIVISLFGFSM